MTVDRRRRRRPLGRPASILAVFALLTGCANASAVDAGAVRGAANRSNRPSSAATRSAAQASTAPVVLIVLENHEASAILGSPDAPYLSGTLIPAGRLFTSYDAVTHPSLPNYLAMTSGGTQGKVGTDSVYAGEVHARNLFAQLSRAHVRWRSYQETMPTPCYRAYAAGTDPRQYALKHDPAMTYADIAGSRRCRRVVPFSELDPTRLPPFSFVTPNLCNDMHSCSVSVGDRWLSRRVPRLLKNGAIVVVTFDEGSTNAGGGGNVVLVEAGAGITAGDTVGHAYDHYSLLAALEDRFGVRRLGNARSADPLPI
ncbi:MAG: alkaline phosphatase family protein [Actinomycetota bacterium]